MFLLNRRIRTRTYGGVGAGSGSPLPATRSLRMTALGRGCFETDVGGFSTRSLANSDVVHVLQPAFMSVRALFEGQSAARLARPRVLKQPGSKAVVPGSIAKVRYSENR